MLKFFERRLEPTGPLPDAPPPTLNSPHAVLQFYWHFVRQIPGPIAAVFTTSFFVAITDAAIPVCMGRVVSLVSAQDPGSRRAPAAGDGGAAPRPAAGCAFRAGHHRQPDADPGPHQSGALAEP